MRSTEDLPAHSSIEVAKHTSPNDAWLIVGGKVLDITSWLNEHPGGDDVLLDLAGRDATREFEDVGHSSDARSQLDHLVIGTLRPATDEELRISRSTVNGSGKLTGTSFENAEILREWINEKARSLRQVGVVGACSWGYEFSLGCDSASESPVTDSFAAVAGALASSFVVASSVDTDCAASRSSLLCGGIRAAPADGAPPPSVCPWPEKDWGADDEAVPVSHVEKRVHDSRQRSKKDDVLEDGEVV
ncbi:Cytochrome B5 [Gracilaria domingensis]|nr:Cytochrome B5 [Gracilaria domingensis]